MKATFKFLNVTKTFQELKLKAKALSQKQARKTVSNLVAELKAVTPVDTGKARDSWSVKETEQVFEITNSVDYIKQLNAGSSKQAPAYFVEKTALKYGTPIGNIVEFKD